jgi:hypothetical protein
LARRVCPFIGDPRREIQSQKETLSRASRRDHIDTAAVTHHETGLRDCANTPSCAPDERVSENRNRIDSPSTHGNSLDSAGAQPYATQVLEHVQGASVVQRHELTAEVTDEGDRPLSVRMLVGLFYPL